MYLSRYSAKLKQKLSLSLYYKNDIGASLLRKADDFLSGEWSWAVLVDFIANRMCLGIKNEFALFGAHFHYIFVSILVNSNVCK